MEITVDIPFFPVTILETPSFFLDQIFKTLKLKNNLFQNIIISTDIFIINQLKIFGLSMHPHPVINPILLYKSDYEYQSR